MFVKRVLSLLMLIGALVGLLGQEAAYAAAPIHASAAIAKISGSTASMAPDCMEMMQKTPQPAQKPCKGMTLDCIAAMGCVVPLAVTPEAALIEKMFYEGIMHFSAPVSALTGRALTPEPEPPTLLI
jgi:hypothetical protein